MNGFLNILRPVDYDPQVERGMVFHFQHEDGDTPDVAGFVNDADDHSDRRLMPLLEHRSINFYIVKKLFTCTVQ